MTTAAHPTARTPATALSLEELTTPAALERVVDEWQALCAACPWATTFQSPDWLLPWWSHLGGGQLMVLALRAGGRLVGLAPLFIYGAGAEPRTLSLLGGGISDQQDVIALPAFAVAAGERVLDHVAERHDAWHRAEFDELSAASPLLAVPAPASMAAQRSLGSVCLAIPLPAHVSELEPRLPHRLRRTLRMVRHRLEASGAFRFLTADQDSMPRLLSALFTLHARRWAAREDPGVLADPRLERFHADVAARLLARHALRLHALELDGAIVGVVYGFAHARRTAAYLSGFDPDASYVSPGAQVLRHAVEFAIDEGMTTFDLLRGEESYKLAWRPLARRNHRLRFGPPDL